MTDTESSRFETTTTVRRPRILLLWAVAALFVLFFLMQTFFRATLGFAGSVIPWWVLGPIVAAIQRRPKVEHLPVAATPEGLTVGGKLVPRAKLKSALLRKEGDHTYVLLRGKNAFTQSVDVEVSSDDDADRLTRALALDAKSTTAEFSLFHKQSPRFPLVVGVVIASVAATFGMIMAMHRGHAISPLAALAPMFALFAMLVIGLPLLIFARTTKLRVGADGIVIRDGLKRSVFHSHDAFTRVHAEGKSVVMEQAHGEPLRYDVGQARGARSKQKVAEEYERQALSVVWRIEKAREAYRSLAGAAPQAALVLERGERTIREWMSELRRVGEGANVTFRNALLTREQLLAIVESTTAAAKERLAAMVALRSSMTEDEKPRVRVAAERCVLPDLRERMVRVIDAPSDEDVALALEEEEEGRGSPREHAKPGS